MPSVAYTASFKKRLGKKEAKLQDAILKTVKRLGEDPRHNGLRTHHVQGTKNPKIFEAYVDKSNRVTWCWGEADQVKLLAHCNHDVLKTPYKSN